MAFSIDATFGALLVGGFCSAVLSGVVLVQTFLYIRLFPQDPVRIKAIVGAVWTLDSTHSILVYVSIWNFLIANYGQEKSLDTISIPLALTGVMTAVLTLIVHCFFAHRIHRLSQQRWSFTTLILVLALFRLCCAAVTSAEMIRLKTFPALLHSNFRFIFSLGLAASCAVDILLTGFFTYTLKTLQRVQTESTSLDRVISALVMYTFETNMLTSVATITSMIFWLVMPHTFLFLAVHFSISKLYANSLLATLNARKQFQDRRQHDMSDVALSSGFPRFSSKTQKSMDMFASRNELLPAPLRINVEKTIEIGHDEPSPLPSPGLEHVSIFEPQAI